MDYFNIAHNFIFTVALKDQLTVWTMTVSTLIAVMTTVALRLLFSFLNYDNDI
jgi:hypothetical protein